MAYDEELAARIRRVFASRDDVEESRMFGGIAFLVNGHMVCGILKDELMVRVGPDSHDDALAKPHARKLDFTDRPMRGFVIVARDGISTQRALGAWIRRGLSFVETLPPK
jgi:TfoX/Sxy family transcriptional regulator of competence genes